MLGRGTRTEPAFLYELSKQLKELCVPAQDRLHKESLETSRDGEAREGSLPFRRSADAPIRALLRATRESRIVTPISRDTNLY